MELGLELGHLWFQRLSWNTPLASSLFPYPFIQPANSIDLMPAVCERPAGLWSSRAEYEMAHGLEQLMT